MLKIIATVAIAVSVLGSGLSAPAFARDGATPDFMAKSRACEGAVRAASMSLDAAERELKALGRRTATRAEYNSARDKVAKAEERLDRARGRC